MEESNGQSENQNEQVKVSFQIDLRSQQTIGEVPEGTSIPDIKNISIKIAESIKKAIEKMSSWVDEMNVKIQSNKHREAYEIFINNKGTAFFINKQLFDDLMLLNTAVLSKDEKKSFLLFMITIAGKEVKFGKAETIIDEFLLNFGDELEPNVKQSIILSKANASAQNNKTNVANYNYKKVIDSDDADPINKAYAYRGLSKITVSKEDHINYHYAAIDRFLEAGEKNEAIKDIVHLSKIFDNESPQKALELLDKAIELYDSENILNKEFLAGVYLTKARYLYTQNNYTEALECAETSCTLRENLIGNEHEKHASYSLALSLCRIVKDVEKEKIYKEKVKVITPLVQNQQFFFQTKILESMDKKEKLDDSTFQEIKNSTFSQLKFAIYLYYARLNAFSFEQRMEWLDEAQLLLMAENSPNNHDYSLLFFEFAELQYKNGLIDDAIKNYEESLAYNPFFSPAMQNFSAILWKEKKWAKSKEVFTRQIEKLGESPTLVYCLGRSHFELGEYQEAFNYFRKVDGKVTGADITSFIQTCIERTKDLKIVLPTEDLKQIETPISIDSFRQTLKEFAATISTNSRMHFWRNDSGKYFWAASPEERGKQHLITALEMKYGKNAIEIIQERPVGAGIIDLYIILRGGLKIILELKICGKGYSSTYAISGNDQLIHYLKNSQTRIGFLIVFDGRKRDFGLGFKEVQSIDNLTLYSVAIDMRPEIV